MIKFLKTNLMKMKFLQTLLITILIILSCSEKNYNYKGVVSAASPEAVTAGLEILEQGIKAVDATIAVTLEDGEWKGAADPRRDGAVGYFPK